MAKTTVIFGILLIALGLVGYLGAGGSTPGSDAKAAVTAGDDAGQAEAGSIEKPKKSVTALIPAFVGGVLLLCGLLSFNEGLRMHAMHGAAVVGLLGCLAGAGRGFMGLGKFLSGDPSLNQRSFLFVWLMAILCSVFVFLCVQSFRAARKRREQGTAAAS